MTPLSSFLTTSDNDEATNLSLRFFPDPVLQKVAREIDEPPEEYEQLAQNMLELLYQAGGIGLAATQVGIEKRLFVIDIPPERVLDEGQEDGQESDFNFDNKIDSTELRRQKNPIVCINPQITSKSNLMPSEEGCLSIPEISGVVERYNDIQVSYYDLTGNEINVSLTALHAFCFQHELDHLDGKLFWDRIKPIRRNIMKKQYKKICRENRK